MGASFSIVLPVSNIELTLEKDIVALMECAAELNTFFEILIYDLGSRDDSYDVACELATMHPQVRCYPMLAGSSLESVIERSREDSYCESICVYHGSNDGINPDEVLKLCREQLAADQNFQINPAHTWKENFKTWSDGRRSSRMTSSPSKGFRFVEREKADGSAFEKPSYSKQ